MFPKTVVQTCVVHLIRYSMRFASWKERRLVAAALKPIYQAESAEGSNHLFHFVHDFPLLFLQSDGFQLHEREELVNGSDFRGKKPTARQRHFESPIVVGAQSQLREQLRESEKRRRQPILISDQRSSPFTIDRVLQKARFADKLLRAYEELNMRRPSHVAHPISIDVRSWEEDFVVPDHEPDGYPMRLAGFTSEVGELKCTAARNLLKSVLDADIHLPPIASL